MGIHGDPWRLIRTLGHSMSQFGLNWVLIDINTGKAVGSHGPILGTGTRLFVVFAWGPGAARKPPRALKI